MSFRELTVYKKAFQLAMDIFDVTKSFPKEEMYSLTDQIRRSTVGEAYRKRQYEKHFVSKTSDADMENTETQVWLDFSKACGYLDEDKTSALQEQSEEVGKLLNHMITYPEKYLRKSDKRE